MKRKSHPFKGKKLPKRILEARRKAREAKTSAKSNKTPTENWDRLRLLIEQYSEAAIADSCKGGSDPDGVPVIEAELVLARAKLEAYIASMMFEFE